MTQQLPEQAHDLPPTPEPESQFVHFLLRALLCIALLVDAFVTLALFIDVVLVNTANPDSGFSTIIPFSLTVLIFAIGIPMAILTCLFYLGYKATRIKSPYI